MEPGLIDNLPPEKLRELPQKQQAYALLRETGVNIQEAAKALGYKTSSAYQIEHRLKRFSLRDKKIVTSAHKVVKNILSGELESRPEIRLQAARMVYDRVEPIVNQANQQPQNTNNFVQINLSCIANPMENDTERHETP